MATTIGLPDSFATQITSFFHFHRAQMANLSQKIRKVEGKKEREFGAEIWLSKFESCLSFCVFPLTLINLKTLHEISSRISARTEPFPETLSSPKSGHCVGESRNILSGKSNVWFSSFHKAKHSRDPSRTEEEMDPFKQEALCLVLCLHGIQVLMVWKMEWYSSYYNIKKVPSSWKQEKLRFSTTCSPTSGCLRTFIYIDFDVV